MKNKSEIVRLLLLQLDEQISQYQTTLAETRKQVIDAPSASQSHSDTSKIQLSGLALGQEGRLREIEMATISLRNLNLSPRDRVVAGAVFVILGRDGERKSYFMFPGAQAVSVEVEGEIVTSISAKSPLGTAVLGKKKGDKATYIVGEVEIIEVF
ncbi:MAG: Transcription elongation factor, GreA/GreB family protein [Candidatus Woesebacteria bacterium GW2011_GWA1_41_13b]|uniref:Transcription elongation factor, GreA/GreB family protein n=1 Tax=Candidatus Woesebacteria bacterium GW2011_GWA1_41_13b TaxID=1618555 RepID=A0A0G0X3N2_9BACT|nr:MAG: Transcription elongation factor, GreA/GreB family protein [Candidatus Woesebacteria bacterium GW2011_GWA1_41_13b]